MTFVKRLLLISILLLFQGHFALGQSPSGIKARPDIGMNVIEFTQGEFIVNKGWEPHKDGWEAAPNPFIDLGNKSGQAAGEYRSMLARFYVDRATLGDNPVAIHVIGMRGNFSVSMNGMEVFRNFADVSDKKNTWYRPFLIPLPANVLDQGLNEIEIHSFSRKGAGVGRVLAGANAALKAYHQPRYFWHITATTATSFSLLVIGFLVFVFWLARRQEVELFWLSISTVLWFGRNHAYFAEDMPLGIALYEWLSLCATYFAMAATAAFYVYFIRLSHRKLIVTALSVLGVVLGVIYAVLSITVLYFYVATSFVTFLLSIIALRDLIRNR